jgi:hypothetical protein
VQLSVLADRVRAAALKGENVNLRELAVIEEAAAAAAAAIVEKQELKPQAPRDEKLEIILVDPRGNKRSLDSSGGSNSPTNTTPPASGSYPSGGFFHAPPTADELRRVEQQNAIDVELDALRRAQDRMQGEQRKQPGAPRRRDRGSSTSWLKN